MTLPISPGTYLANPDEPSFVIGVPSLFTGPVAKPAINSAMLGPMVEFILHFWPMWDNDAALVVADIIAQNNGEMSGDITWQAAQYGQGIGGNVTLGTDKIVITPVTISGSYSLERLVKIAGNWVHEIIVNDEVANSNTQYLNGVAQNPTTFITEPVVLSDLIQWTGAGVTNPFLVEYARIWDKALTNYEVTDLYTNPYIMFGMTQEILDEITTIINFMKPMRSSWNFVYE